jgi:oxygen-independent coproporphyrinogen-3 oxidase
MNAADLIAKYDRRVPRYTSYPTAPHFSPAVTAADYAAWLGRLEDDAELSLYLHVPFCASLCLFCACHTSVVRRPEPLVSYGKTMLTEIELVAAAIGRRLKVRHIHWGGGTPCSLPPAQMRDVMRSLRTHFDIVSDAEIAVEIDPRELSDASLRVLGEMGTTRASLGVQDFDAQVQHAINRVQDFALTANCAERRRSFDQSRPDLRPAAPDGGGRRSDGGASAAYRARPGRGVRLCACAVDEEAPGAAAGGRAAQRHRTLRAAPDGRERAHRRRL